PPHPASSTLFPYTTLFRSVASILGVEGVREDAEFSDAVGCRLNGGSIYEQIVAIATIHVKVVGAAAAAIDRHGTRLIAAIEQIGDRKSTRLNSSHVAISYA